jgi:hypothetical protein
VFDDLLGVITSTVSLRSVEQPPCQLLASHVEMDHGLEFDPFYFFRCLVRRLGLSQVPRETIEHVAAPTTCLDDCRSQHFEYQLIGHKIAAP